MTIAVEPVVFPPVLDDAAKVRADGRERLYLTFLISSDEHRRSVELHEFYARRGEFSDFSNYHALQKLVAKNRWYDISENYEDGWKDEESGPAKERDCEEVSSR